MMKAGCATAVLGVIVLVAGLAGCNSERVAGSPSSLREQEVVRLRATNSSKPPIIAGVVQSVDDAGRYPVSKALVSIDGQAYYTNETGTYQVAVAPGSHQLVASQTGMRPVRTTVKVAPGDSVRVNLYLRLTD